MVIWHLDEHNNNVLFTYNASKIRLGLSDSTILNQVHKKGLCFRSRTSSSETPTQLLHTYSTKFERYVVYSLCFSRIHNILYICKIAILNTISASDSEINKPFKAYSVELNLNPFEQCRYISFKPLVNFAHIWLNNVTFIHLFK